MFSLNTSLILNFYLSNSDQIKTKIIQNLNENSKEINSKIEPIKEIPNPTNSITFPVKIEKNVRIALNIPLKYIDQRVHKLKIDLKSDSNNQFILKAVQLSKGGFSQPLTTNWTLDQFSFHSDDISFVQPDELMKTYSDHSIGFQVYNPSSKEDLNAKLTLTVEYVLEDQKAFDSFDKETNPENIHVLPKIKGLFSYQSIFALMNLQIIFYSKIFFRFKNQR